MKKIDSRHLVFHIAVALYFIWMVIFALLLGMALFNVFGRNPNPSLGLFFIEWISTNLIMGSTLFAVIRLFRNRTLLDKIVLYSFCVMAAAGVAVLFVVNGVA